jgi:hypothetical protein
MGYLGTFTEQSLHLVEHVEGRRGRETGSPFTGSEGAGRGEGRENSGGGHLEEAGGGEVETSVLCVKFGAADGGVCRGDVLLCAPYLFFSSFKIQ